MGTKPSNPKSNASASTPQSRQGPRLTLLEEGEIVSCDLAPTGSNYTFLVKIQDAQGAELRGVYKPRDGESPLWDFEPGTLYKREYAAYLLSQILGWTFIPETVIREGPYGVGSVQRYVDHDSESYYRTIREEHREELRTIACFDIIANNADRKAVHCFKGEDHRIWGIDHGLTFNQDPKLRTVIWDFWGEVNPDGLQKPMEDLLEKAKNPQGEVKELFGLLETAEEKALLERVDWMVSMGTFPKLLRS